MKLAIIDTGSSNRFSVKVALSRLGATVFDAPTPEDAQLANGLVLPGVGAAGPAMTALETSGWKEQLRQEVRPVLGICLGMQLLFDHSEEGNVEGLGIINGTVRRLPARDLTWPHMGWNALRGFRPDPLVAGVSDGDFMYFAHGFYAPAGPATRAIVRYGDEISAIVRQDNFMGCQFHPERSSQAGRQVLRNFCELAR